MILDCEHIGILTTHHDNITTEIKAVSTQESRGQQAGPTKTSQGSFHICCQAYSIAGVQQTALRTVYTGLE